MTKQGLKERYRLAAERAKHAEQRRDALDKEYQDGVKRVATLQVAAETAERNLLHLANRRGLAISEANDAARAAAEAKREWEAAE